MNISCGVISNGDIAQLANNQVTMNKIRSVPNSTSHFWDHSREDMMLQPLNDLLTLTNG